MSTNAVPMKPVSKDLLYMKVADAIHRYIHENKLQPGEKIPSERVLAEQLCTGRNSVREALRVLENEGLIQVKTGRGAFVTEKSSPDSIYLKLFMVNYFELLEIKAILDREVIRKIIDKAIPAQLKELDEILVLVEEKSAVGLYDGENDKRFHRKMLRIAGNMSLEQMVGRLIDVLGEYATLLDSVDQIFLTTIPHHRRLLEAMKRRDAQEAYDAHAKILEIDVSALEAVEKSKQV